MDISKISDAKKVDLCKKYFFIGAICLPFVWVANVCWFFNEAFVLPVTTHRQQIRKYVIGSIVGTAFWIIIIAAWETFFQYYRQQGLEWTDYLTFVFPKGRV